MSRVELENLHVDEYTACDEDFVISLQENQDHDGFPPNLH